MKYKEAGFTKEVGMELM